MIMDPRLIITVYVIILYCMRNTFTLKHRGELILHVTLCSVYRPCPQMWGRGGVAFCYLPNYWTDSRFPDMNFPDIIAKFYLNVTDDVTGQISPYLPSLALPGRAAISNWNMA